MNAKITSQTAAMKKLFIVAGAAVLTACGAATEEAPQDKAGLQMRQQELKMELAMVDSQLNALDTAQVAFDRLQAVEVMEVPKGMFEHYFQAQGNVEAEQNVMLYAQVGGNIRSINVEVGQMVSKGQTLVSFDTDVISQQIKELETRLELATFTYDKQKNLWEQNIGSELQFRQAKNQKESLELSLKALREQRGMSVITAPFAGRIDEVMPNVGEMVPPGMPVLRLINLKEVYIEASIPENYLNRVKKGNYLRVRFEGMNMTIDSLEVSDVGQYVNAANRTLKVRVDVPNEDYGLVPNLLGLMEVRDYVNKEAVKVPSKYIRQDMNGDSYVLLFKEGIVKDQMVSMGLTYKDGNNPEAVSWTEILDGLSGGETLITEGYKNVRPDERVRVKTK